MIVVRWPNYAISGVSHKMKCTQTRCVKFQHFFSFHWNQTRVSVFWCCTRVPFTHKRSLERYMRRKHKPTHTVVSSSTIVASIDKVLNKLYDIHHSNNGNQSIRFGECHFQQKHYVLMAYVSAVCVCVVLETIVDEITLLIYVSFIFNFYWQFRHNTGTNNHRFLFAWIKSKHALFVESELCVRQHWCVCYILVIRWHFAHRSTIQSRWRIIYEMHKYGLVLCARDAFFLHLSRCRCLNFNSQINSYGWCS